MRIVLLPSDELYTSKSYLHSAFKPIEISMAAQA
jgi:hypothetical protein